MIISPNRRNFGPLLFPAEVALADAKYKVLNDLPSHHPEFTARAHKIAELIDEARALTTEILEEYLCPPSAPG